MAERLFDDRAGEPRFSHLAECLAAWCTRADGRICFPAMGLPDLIGRHSRHPRGFVGRIITRMMARRTSPGIPWTVDLLELSQDHRVVDVGFGRGDSLAFLLERTLEGHVAGVELSDTMLQAAATRFREAISSERLSLHRTDDGTIPLEDASFDRAVSLNTIYITEYPAALFGEMFRVLAPGGRAALTFPEREGFADFPPARTEGFFLHQLADLRRAMSEAGFVDVVTHSEPDLPLNPQCLVGRRAR